MPNILATIPTLQAPAGACDCHVHFFGSPTEYPVVPQVRHVPTLASVEEYRQVMARLRLDRVVIVQPVVYGLDNRCTLDAVRRMGDRARAVVVVGPDVADAELERLTRAGARGIRFQMLGDGALSWEVMEEMAQRVHPFGWHVQLQLDGRELADREEFLGRLPGTLVIDHTGRFVEPVQTSHPGFRALMRLVDSGRCWVKLSAPYDTSKYGPPDFKDVGVLGRTLIAAAPERMLWATNWPHPSPTRPLPPDDAMLLDVLLHWCDDSAVRDRILASNPAELYGFQ